MSVFVDITPDEAQVVKPAAEARPRRWRGRLTRAALPLLSVVVFLVVWQLAAASGHLEPDLRALPGHGLAGVPRRLDHPRRSPRLRRLPAVGAPLHDAAPCARRRRDRRRARRAARPGHGLGRLGAQRARAVADVPARAAAAGLLLPAGDLAGHRRGAEDHAARAGRAAARRGRHHGGRRRRARRTAARRRARSARPGRR